MRRETLEALLAARAARRAVALLTSLTDGSQRVHDPARADPDAPLAEEIAAALRADRSATVQTPEGPLFVQVFNPPLRLLIVGAVHIAQFLAPLARQLGYAVTIVDPRRSFATAERFPGAHLVTEWPDEALAALAPDSRSAVITLTHDPKLDDPALAAALASPAFYIGCLGSTRTHARRLERLTGQGVSDADRERLHGPLGLAIGARSPAEVALAALAQMTSVLRGGRVR